ncbi:unnamed protein product, partial [marine sediment metagenome]
MTQSHDKPKAMGIRSHDIYLTEEAGTLLVPSIIKNDKKMAI